MYENEMLTDDLRVFQAATSTGEEDRDSLLNRTSDLMNCHVHALFSNT